MSFFYYQNQFYSIVALHHLYTNVLNYLTSEKMKNHDSLISNLFQETRDVIG